MNCRLLFPKHVVTLVMVSIGGFAAIPQLLADTFEIRGLGIITGKLLNEPGSSVLKILTNDGVELEIASSKLKPPAIVSAEKEKAYLASFLGKEDSVELHRAVSKECELKSLSFAHKERVVELDPSDENWRALGEMVPDKKSGEYIHRDVAFRREGKVKVNGRWHTPQSLAIFELEKKQDADVAAIRSAIKISLQNLNDRGPKQAKALDYFNKLENPNAIEVIFNDYIKKDITPGQLDVFMPILARMPGNTASYVFVYLAMNAKNNELVRVSLELLAREQSKAYAMNAFLNVIRDPKSKLEAIDLAGTHIQSFPDKVAIPDLIERLISIIKTTITLPQDTATFNRDGSGGGISTPRTEKRERIHNHQTVLTALLALSDGNNYNFDIPQWRIWYANTYSKSNLDLRRDE